jgi:hypothetical protein
MLLLQITSARKEAQTWDEAVYISAGYSYWKTGDFRLNPEHPRRSGSVDYAFAGCALGAALSTKLSGLALVPIFALLAIGQTVNLKAFARGVVLAALAAVVVIGLLYHRAPRCWQPARPVSPEVPVTTQLGRHVRAALAKNTSPKSSGSRNWRISITSPRSKGTCLNRSTTSSCDLRRTGEAENPRA